MKKILVLEPGAWGTTLGILLSRKHKLSFWYEKPSLALKISKLRENERLPGVKIPEKILVSSKLEKVINNQDLVIIASPSFNFRRTLLKLKKFDKLPPLMGIAKGIEKESLYLPHQIVKKILGNVPYAHLSGPGFAREIIKGRKAKEVIASKDACLLEKLKKIFQIANFDISVTQDLIGLQLAGALKNVFSIGIGLIEAKNPIPEPKKTKKILFRLGLEEMIKIGEKLGAEAKTFRGPAGLGDLILTSSPLSRNWRFGYDLFKNASETRKLAEEKIITVEGFDSSLSVFQLAQKHKIKLPFVSEIYKVVSGKVFPEKTIKNLIKLTEKL